MAWDDDTDVIVDIHHRDTFLRNLHHLASELNLNIATVFMTNCYKFFFKDSHPTKRKPELKYPFIDIFFYETKSFQICEERFPNMIKVCICIERGDYIYSKNHHLGGTDIHLAREL